MGDKYINADKLIKDLRDNAAGHFNSVVNSIIITQPSADVAAIKHGKWEQIPYEVEYRCSECKGHSPYTFDENERRYYEFLTNFCPHCGADMRLVKQNDL